MSRTAASVDRILELLLASEDRFLSGSDIAARLGVSRTMVWKHIAALKQQGVRIEASPAKGYRLVELPDMLRAPWITRSLNRPVIGKEILLSAELLSTNTSAMEHAARGAAEGAVIVAESQTQGKGRLGRQWISPRGNLYFSIILRPPLPPHKAPLLTLMGAVAVATAIRTQCGLAASIKWPNDILLDGRKVAGLLTEMSAEPDRIRHVALGIGINVNMPPDELPGELRTHVTTLSHEQGAKIDRNMLLGRVLTELDRCYRAFLEDQAGILHEWKDLNITIGSRVSVSAPAEVFEGTAEDIDAEGRLVVRMEHGEARIVAAGDVTLLKKERG